MKSSKRKMPQTQISMFLDKETAKAMCTQKLRKLSTVQGNLCQTLLVRNTLKYVQSNQYAPLHGGSEFAEYKPLEKKHCPDTSIVEDVDIYDIDDILNEMFLPHPLIPPDEDELSFDWPMKDSLSRVCNTNKDPIVPDTEVLGYDEDSIKPGTEVLVYDDDFFSELFSRRTNLTVTKFTKQLKRTNNEHRR